MPIKRSGRPLTAPRLGRRRVLALGGALAAAAFLRPPRRALAVRRRTVLPNGLVVIVDDRRAADTVAFQLSSRSGTRDDGDLPGLNSLTAGLMFQGTRTYPSPTALQRAIAAVGGTLGRGQGYEIGVFTSVVPASEVDTAYALLGEIVNEPLMTGSTLNALKQGALQQLGQRRSDPTTLLADLYQATFFAGTPLAPTTIGTEAGIQATNLEAVLINRQRAWSAANLVLTIAGNIAPDEAIAKAELAFGALPAGQANVRVAAAPSRPPGQLVPARVAGTQSQFRVGFPAPPLGGSADRYAFAVLNSLMSGVSGRFFLELRTLRGLAYTASSSYVTYTDSGTWFATAGIEPTDLETALAVVSAELDRLLASPPSEGEIADRVELFTGSAILAVETNAQVAGRYATEEVLGEVTIDGFLAGIRAVTPADVLRVARTYIDPAQAITVIVGPDQ